MGGVFKPVRKHRVLKSLLDDKGAPQQPYLIPPLSIVAPAETTGSSKDYLSGRPYNRLTITSYDPADKFRREDGCASMVSTAIGFLKHEETIPRQPMGTMRTDSVTGNNPQFNHKKK